MARDWAEPLIDGARELLAGRAEVIAVEDRRLRARFDDGEVAVRLTRALPQSPALGSSAIEGVLGAIASLRCEAAAPGGERLRLRLAPGYVYPAFRRLGVRDDQLGHAGLDDRFIVWGDDLALARAWLAPSADALLALYDPTTWAIYRAWVRRGRAAIRRDAADPDAALVVRAIEATRLLAGGGRALATRAAEVADALGGRAVARTALAPDGAAALRFASGGVAVEVALVQRRTGLLRRGRATETVVRAEATAEVRGAAARPAAEQVDAARSLGGALRLGRGAVELALDGVVLDGERLAAAGAIVARVVRGAATAGAPYR